MMKISDIQIGDDQISITKRQGQFKIISKHFGGSTATIDVSIFNMPDFAEQFIEWMESPRIVTAANGETRTKPPYAPNTIKSYLGAILALGEQVSIPTICQKKLKKYLNDIGNVKSTTQVDEQFMSKLDANYGKKRRRNIDLIIDIVRHVGPIRMSDMIKTKVKNDDGICNFIDFDEGMWYISTHSTKNKTRRNFPISETAIKAINKHLYPDSEYLLLTRNFEPHADTAALSDMFIKTTGMTYKVVRKSYTEIANRDKDSLFMVNLANILGHQPSTQLTDYSVTPPLGFISHTVPTETLSLLINNQPLPTDLVHELFPNIDNHLIKYRQDEDGHTTLPFTTNNRTHNDPLYIICLEGSYVLTMERNEEQFKKNLFPGDCVFLSGNAISMWSHSISVANTDFSRIIKVLKGKPKPIIIRKIKIKPSVTLP